MFHLNELGEFINYVKGRITFNLKHVEEGFVNLALNVELPYNQIYWALVRFKNGLRL